MKSDAQSLVSFRGEIETIEPPVRRQNPREDLLYLLSLVCGIGGHATSCIEIVWGADPQEVFCIIVPLQISGLQQWENWRDRVSLLSIFQLVLTQDVPLNP